MYLPGLHDEQSDSTVPVKGATAFVIIYFPDGHRSHDVVPMALGEVKLPRRQLVHEVVKPAIWNFPGSQAKQPSSIVTAVNLLISR
jgi:hypothetical protein